MRYPSPHSKYGVSRAKLMNKERGSRINEVRTNEREPTKAENTGGPTVINVHIGADGNKQITHVSFMAYGKGHAHKPLIIIEQEPQ